jgi:8-oxo-dGTP pyrophosphatase MutT (NUDIX family)
LRAVHLAEGVRQSTAEALNRNDVAMARRAEFYHDPLAPKINSLRPAAFASVRDGSGRLLLVRRADTLNWELPGGKVELGESAPQAAVREVLEESGVEIRVLGLCGVYTDPGHVMAYLSGEVRQQFALCFHALPLAGEPRPDQDETIGAGWFATAELDEIDIHPSVRLRIDHAVNDPDTVHFV